MACNEDLALHQRDNVVRRACIVTRRRANIVIHANTAPEADLGVVKSVAWLK
jgi:hypothetical protein